MKRHATELMRVVRHLVMDIVYHYPALATDLRKDTGTVVKLLKDRGLSLFTVDFIQMGKHLDRCLSAGLYTRSKLPCSRAVSDRIVIPKLFRGLYLQIFEKNGCLRADASVDCVRYLRQVLFLAKKTTLPCGPERDALEVSAFVALDNSLPEPNGFWGNTMLPTPDVGFSTKGVDSELESMLEALDTVSCILTCDLGPYRVSDHTFKHGPGAVSNLPSGSNKYVWTNWSTKLESSYPIADCGFHSYSAWAAWTAESVITDNEPHSKLICVPKTIKRPRLIAAEPSEHQWAQQNCWNYFERAVSRSWVGAFVHFRDQTHNQNLCLEGSKDDSLSTLDLSSASDRVTCGAVERLFRCNPHLLRCLRACRTMSVQLPSGEIHHLRKYATMGNATTFPVQSLLFLCVCLAAVLSKDRRKPTRGDIMRLVGKVSVFGDDLIIPKDSSGRVVRLLEALGFKVNTDKSFVEGNFRESCGVDAFRGVDVTPAYWKEPCTAQPDSVARTVAVHNNFFEKYYVNAARCLASTIPTGRVRGISLRVPVVRPDSGIFGLHSRTTSPTFSPKVRYNKYLQCKEAHVMAISSHCAVSPIEDDTALLQYFTESPSPFMKWKGGVRATPTVNITWGWVPKQYVCSSTDY